MPLPAAMDAVMHAAHIEAMRLVAAAIPGAQTATLGHWFVYDAGVENPDFNVAYVTGDPALAAGELPSVVAWFLGRGADWRFKLRPGFEDAVIASLEGRGLELGRREPYLAIDLAELEPPAEHFHIGPVTSRQDLADYESFDATRGRPPEWSIAGAVMDLPGCTLWVARAAGGEPVARAMSVALLPAATIHNVFVAERYRRLGWGRAITAVALLHARAAGCQFGALGASELGYPVYRAMGFERRYDLATFATTLPPSSG